MGEPSRRNFMSSRPSGFFGKFQASQNCRARPYLKKLTKTGKQKVQFQKLPPQPCKVGSQPTVACGLTAHPGFRPRASENHRGKEPSHVRGAQGRLPGRTTEQTGGGVPGSVLTLCRLRRRPRVCRDQREDTHLSSVNVYPRLLPV